MEGPAVGGGWAWAVAAVATLATPGAMFRFPELRLGLAPWTRRSAACRPPSVPAAAFRLLVADERFTGDDLALLGLVDAVEAADLGHRARHLAEQFAAAPSDLVRTLRTA